MDKLKATGEVDEMKDVADFAGGYLDARIGLAVTLKTVGASLCWRDTPQRKRTYMGVEKTQV